MTKGISVMDSQTPKWFSLDWKWIVAGYCYLVLFHLLPTFLMGALSVTPILPYHRVGVQTLDLAAIWLLGGISVVAFFVGRRSPGITIAEPVIAGVIYALTTALGFRQLASSNVRGREVLAVIFWTLIVIILSAAGAWLGEMAQRRMAQNRSQ
ncbi:MAG: hypothetical protein A2X67_08445 [Ignavibacteria bacterium GWA2_55_11]|nr:MAG: hypothetical protein A2X67_08445 [Ignavibacteria bacterium GWA2_55_11]OGU44464.1 MAG: hypothetical protein A2X68_05140 [Ignavibacteria bacterium GWC2_56_12]OGU69964.1 MAG: hypothetical protein A3H45_06740 [Ignavibacteria bacterium RIFCSPLOWO2_02_FULL_55_14]OGU72523.1 MAG: hypothetical protein A3G43_06975 [Ignavibacteria bacterium RIFCSPLOWO2_12_FULL_56_21]